MSSPLPMSTFRVLVTQDDGTVTRSHPFPTYDAALRHLGDIADAAGFDSVAIEHVPASRQLVGGNDD